MNEILKKIEDEENITYETIEYDYDLDDEEVKPHNVGTILPVYILLENDKEIARSTGEKSKQELIDFFKDNGAL